MTTHTTPVSILGLGLMGQALAEAFVRAGHPTTVWNRTAAKADKLKGLGANVAASVEAAVAASPLVIVCVSDYDAVHKLLDPLGDVLEGRTLVNLSSGTSAQARTTAERLGGTYLDGAIMAVPAAIATADAVILYSGPQPAFDAHAPALRALAPAATTYLGDDPGLSSLHDVALLSLMWNVLNGFLQGAALVGTAGVSATKFAPLTNDLLTTMTGWLTSYAKQIDDGAYPAVDATIDTHLGAIEHLLDESESLGVNAELPSFLKLLGDRAVADGHGGEGYAALIEVFRKPSAGQDVRDRVLG